MSFVLFATFFLCFVIFFFLLKISFLLNLIDIPNSRKTHATPVPYTGGLCIGLTFILIIFLAKFQNTVINQILIYSFVVSIIGLIDDKFDLSVLLKLSLLTFPIFFLSTYGLTIKNLGYYPVIGIIELGSLGIIFTITCCLLLINSVNYSDGIDGFAASLFISSIINLFILVNFQIPVNNEFLYLLLLILVPLSVFLIFNMNTFSYKKIFLGDSGSLMLGFLLSFLIIFAHNNIKIHPALLIWTISFFIFEFISTNLIRLSHRKNIFDPGKDHFHFEIYKKTYSNNLTILIGVAINSLFFLVGFFIFSHFNSIVSLLTFLFSIFIYCYLRIKIRNN
jgi:UDP-GlcNAc:undecaprenyl-phosphate GlcNAc-1-phosphate transferase